MQTTQTKMKLLLVAGSFGAGGAEKSMVNYLNTIDPQRYEVYLLVFNNSGLFKPLIPAFVHYLPLCREMKALHTSITDKTFFTKDIGLWIKKVIRTFRAKYCQKKLHVVQSIWRQWMDDIPELNGVFDIAVGQQEGLTNYYVIDKINAKRKILWIHNQYEKLRYNSEFDYPYFSKSSTVLTISQICLQNLISNFPRLEQKFAVLPNIVNRSIIINMSEQQIESDLYKSNACNIISVGRLSAQKAYDMAIEAAALLKKENFNFRWIVVGEGPERGQLEKKIQEYGLDNSFFLIGLRENPYAYISKANLAVQSSRFEGKSIFVDEAKILGKVLVLTNYDTVYDQIENGRTGVVVKMTPESLAEGIIQTYANKQLQTSIVTNLKKERLDNSWQIKNYYTIYEGIDNHS